MQRTMAAVLALVPSRSRTELTEASPPTCCCTPRATAFFCSLLPPPNPNAPTICCRACCCPWGFRSPPAATPRSSSLTAAGGGDSQPTHGAALFPSGTAAGNLPGPTRPCTDGAPKFSLVPLPSSVHAAAGRGARFGCFSNSSCCCCCCCCWRESTAGRCTEPCALAAKLKTNCMSSSCDNTSGNDGRSVGRECQHCCIKCQKGAGQCLGGGGRWSCVATATAICIWFISL
mmetsp:Transcript_21807/g.34993  ORF Transcript_21807/g.34993 Transcript_21807/m.34993 type:complete len:231 (-) Transcript_21807:2082-2774(-)